MADKIFDIPVEDDTKKQNLEKINKYIENPSGFFHIVSLNPEIVVESQKNPQFQKVLQQAQIKLIDGVGVRVAAQLLGVRVGGRVAGVELMENMLKVASERSLKVLLIGGKPKVAERVIECQKDAYSGIKWHAFSGIYDISRPTEAEEKRLLSIVADVRPHFVFVAFGSPAQELWIYSHKEHLSGLICMGVGGAFDFLSGRVTRAPRIVRLLGFEWFFRLIIEPWRWRRQLRLLEFIWLVVKAKLPK